MNSIHNASHRQSDYFEWWYIHIATPDGMTLNVVIHETDIFGLSATPYLSMTVMLPNQPPLYLKRPLTGIAIGRSGAGLQVGTLVQETVAALWLDIPFPEQSHLRARLLKRKRPFAPNDGILYADKHGRRSHWLVNIPWADVTGVLMINGREYPLAGWGYQDHQWGALPIQEFASAWVWGQMSDGETAVVFFQLLTQWGEWIERVGVWVEGEGVENGRWAGARLETDYLQLMMAQERPEAVGASMRVGIPALHSQLTFALNPAQLMRNRSGERVGNNEASYARWGVQGAYVDGRGERWLFGIAEMLHITPAR